MVLQVESWAWVSAASQFDGKPFEHVPVRFEADPRTVAYLNLFLSRQSHLFPGDVLGILLGVKANVGSLGLAMMLLMAARVWLQRRGILSHGIKLGVEFWATMYIPIVVAMAAQKNVVAAVRGGPVVLITAVLATGFCFATLTFVGRIGRDRRHKAEVEPVLEHGGQVIGGALQIDTPRTEA